jgi:hypothetical protein
MEKPTLLETTNKPSLSKNYNRVPKLETSVFLSFDNYMNGKMHVIGNYTQTPHSPSPKT